MNALELLNHVVALLKTEAQRGPGTVFLMHNKGVFSATRTGSPDEKGGIVASYNCDTFCNGLSSHQYAALMHKAMKAKMNKTQPSAPTQKP